MPSPAVVIARGETWVELMYNRTPDGKLSTNPTPESKQVVYRIDLVTGTWSRLQDLSETLEKLNLRE